VTNFIHFDSFKNDQ